MRRKAVAATLTSVVVFASILGVNQMIYSTANQSLRAVSVVSIERAESINSRIFASMVVFDLLSQGGGNTSRHFVKEGVNYFINVTMHRTETEQFLDNLTLLAPLNGFKNGSINFIVHISMRATAGPGLPSFIKTETHFIHEA